MNDVLAKAAAAFKRPLDVPQKSASKKKRMGFEGTLSDDSAAAYQPFKYETMQIVPEQR